LERLLSIANLFKNKAKVLKEAYAPLLQHIVIENCENLE
jgi:hypothetical protein